MGSYLSDTFPAHYDQRRYVGTLTVISSNFSLGYVIKEMQ